MELSAFVYHCQSWTSGKGASLIKCINRGRNNETKQIRLSIKKETFYNSQNLRQDRIESNYIKIWTKKKIDINKNQWICYSQNAFKTSRSVHMNYRGTEYDEIFNVLLLLTRRLWSSLIRLISFSIIHSTLDSSNCG